MKRICILYTNSGAGHRSVARALEQELKKNSDVKVETIDFAKEYDLPIFRKSENLYKFSLQNLKNVRDKLVATANYKLPTQMLLNTYDILALPHYNKFIKDHPADLYISTYYFDIALFKYLKKKIPQAPLIMMVTDIVYPIRIWFHPTPDLTILPTKEIYDLGFKYFKNYKDKIEVMGLPIASIFFENRSKEELKKELDIPSLPMIFVSGGGEGMDQVPDIVKEIDKDLKDVFICVICGKDKKQKALLDKYDFKNRVMIHGWTDKFAEYLLCSDIFITKAGAISIWEAMSSNKKTIIYDYIKDQEKGNIEFAQKYFNAKFITDPKKIASSTKGWLTQPLKITKNKYMQNWTKEISKELLDRLED